MVCWADDQAWARGTVRHVVRFADRVRVLIPTHLRVDESIEDTFVGEQLLDGGERNATQRPQRGQLGRIFLLSPPHS